MNKPVGGARWLGPGENSEQWFLAMNEAGLDELEQRRNEINALKGDGIHRGARTWSTSQAAEMVSRSPSWLREQEPNTPKNEAGHSRWPLKRIHELMELAGVMYHRPEGAQGIALALSKFKGGVGNSTNVLHLAHGLAIKGLKVLVWDHDGQGSATQNVGGLIPDLELDEEDLAIYPLSIDPSAIVDPECKIVRGTYFHNVDLIPANTSLNDLEMTLLMQFMGNDTSAKTDIAPEFRMSAVLQYLKGYYDVILIDCPPSLGVNTMNALLAADGIITSVKPDMFDRASLVSYMDALATMCERSHKEYRYFRILISQYQDGITTNHRGEAVESGHRGGEIALRKLYEGAVMENMMHYCKEIRNASEEFSSVLANEKPIGSRGAYNRAVTVVNDVVNEVYEDLKQLWEQERNDE